MGVISILQILQSLILWGTNPSTFAPEGGLMGTEIQQNVPKQVFKSMAGHVLDVKCAGRLTVGNKMGWKYSSTL